jgi:outer membrane murein-binding lipoprotein Lpp
MHPRRNFLWGIIAVSIAAILLLMSSDVLPAGVEDVLSRSWSALLVLFGLGVLLRNRLPAGGFLSVVASVLLVAGVAFFAYSTRAGQQRSDNVQTIAQTISSGVSLLQVNLETLTTDVELALADTARTVSGEFAGGYQSVVSVDYIEDNTGLATLTVRESMPEAFPPLEAVGRGTLRLEIPADVPVDIAFSGADGDATFNLSGVDLERLNVDLRNGDMLITMPEYEPRSPAAQAQPGTLTVRRGDLTLFIPQTVAARLEIDRGSSGIEPQFDSTIYDYIGNVLLENRNFATSDIVIRYSIVVPNGQIEIAQ